MELQNITTDVEDQAEKNNAKEQSKNQGEVDHLKRKATEISWGKKKKKDYMIQNRNNTEGPKNHSYVLGKHVNLST